jgi:hypothetical protein
MEQHDLPPRKRLRSEGGIDYDDLIGVQLPHREIVHSLVVISKEDAASLSARVSNAHTKVFDARRQVEEMAEAISKEQIPRGWKLQTVSLGPESDAAAATIDEIQRAAFLQCYGVMKAEKARVADLHVDTREGYVTDAIAGKVAAIQRRIVSNPEAYPLIQIDEMRDLVTSAARLIHTSSILKADAIFDTTHLKRLEKLA